MMRMRRPDCKQQSDIDCEKLVNYYNSIGHTSRIATSDEDQQDKFDFIVDGMKIDLKRYSHLYCEIDKLQNPLNEADCVLMIVNNDVSHAYSIKKTALIRICAEYVKPLSQLKFDEIPILNESKNPNVAYHYGSDSGDRLADFTIDMFDKNDYKVVDLSKILS